MGVNSKVVEARGGGWYKLPDGSKVRGKALALARADELATGQSTTSVGRLRFLRDAGLQYRGVRDIYTTAGYVQQGDETFDHYWALYERDPVAGRIVDMPAKTTWKSPPEVFEGEAEKEQQTKFETAWMEMVKRLSVWEHFAKVDRLSRVGRYAVLFVGIRGGEDAQLVLPVESVPGPEDIMYLSSYAEKYAKIEQWDQNSGSERFGLPDLYKIDLSSGVQQFAKGSLLVHHSRVIHVAEDTLVDNVFGRPALKRALNAMDDLLKVTASTGEAFWQLASRILAGKIDPGATVPAQTMTDMGEALEEMVHDLRRQFIGHGVDLSWLSGETPKPAEALELYKQLMAVASGIPTRILFGSEQGQLASSQDERTWFGTINERQEHHAEPNILRAFIDRMVSIRALPPHSADGYSVVWPALFEASEEDVAKSNLARAQAAKELTAMGGDPTELVEIDGDRNVWLLPTEEIEKRRAEREDEEAKEQERMDEATEIARKQLEEENAAAAAATAAGAAPQPVPPVVDGGAGAE
jgi:hypothetical protein